MAVTLPIAMAAGMMGTARNNVAVASFGGASGVGGLALAATLGGGVSGIFAGSLADRFAAQRILITVNLCFALSALTLWLLVFTSALTPLESMTLAAIDGALTALSVTSVVKLQVATVPAKAKGAAEVLNGLKASLGALAGVFVTTRLGGDSAVIVICAVLFSLVAALVAAGRFRAPAAEDHPSAPPATFGTLLRAIVRDHGLRDVVIADLVMYLVLPTILLGLAVVDEAIPEYSPLFVSVGIVGVLIGRLVLAARGTSGRVPLALTLAALTYAALAITALVLMDGDWKIGHIAALAFVAMAGSACGSFIQALLAAKVQERLPDELRARGTGFLYGLRAIKVAIGVIVVTYFVTVWTTRVYLGVLTLLLLAVVIGLRGFRRVT